MMRLAVAFCAVAVAVAQDLPPSCDSPIYCYGDIIRTVNLATPRLFNDSKSFVDLRLINSPNVTVDRFAVLTRQTRGIPTRDQLQQFLAENFAPGDELTNATLSDFNPDPPFLKRIADTDVRNFTRELIAIWPTLARKVKPEVWENQDRYSFIPVPNTFIIPGGRFTEYYYWDSFWIIEGLLVSGMNETARGMIDNFASLVERYGFIPNGGRVYYLRRSQPPLFTSMAYAYFKQTRNVTWLRQHIATLDKELNYFVSNQSLYACGHLLFRYDAPSYGPRPESYREDYATAAYLPEESSKDQLYIDLKSGAESGWDFSSRWIFDSEGGNNANLSHIATRRVIPVDLNAFLCRAFRELSELYRILGNKMRAFAWKAQEVALEAAIKAVLYDAKSGIWYDYDIELGRHRKYFYPSNLAPLWANCVGRKQERELGRRVLEYLKKTKVLDYLGGTPTSTDNTGEQWDFPNAWPPLQDIIVRALDNSGYEEAKKEARILAKRWVTANMIGFQETGEMFEKYDAVVPGRYGGGGEYEVQAGFGWSNGVCLKFIYDYYT